ncbi:hypothetical protein DBZ36_11860 [Alginatibacterium sediminis]|uniref:Cupin domain-containing protein n=1 Tax=Alginatibacterium sediminis TaxID=2164068 RepID=A0A420EB75_9ALTE|nr:hypothetical protein [Alginatibacterium sediminis]RKF17938.1 hypothetical protein DBZ36_11860 [Alginatibacterium sediminis]
MFDIEAGAVEYPLHASDKPWIAYVMQGSGTVFYGDQGGSKTDGITFSNGDFISFSENAQHGWLCDCATKIMLVRAS